MFAVTEKWQMMQHASNLLLQDILWIYSLWAPILADPLKQCQHQTL